MTNQYEYIENTLDIEELEAMRKRQLTEAKREYRIHRSLTIMLYILGIPTIGVMGIILASQGVLKNEWLSEQSIKLGYFSLIGVIGFAGIKIVQKIFYEGME